MKSLTLYFSPSQLAEIRNCSIQEIFQEIRSGLIPFEDTSDGIRIPIVYYLEFPEK